VLVLDDEEAVRESLSDFFEDRDWDVISAETSFEALDMLSDKKPDCVVVDIRLPDIDGNEFIRRAALLNSRLAFVICTGSPEYLQPDDIAALPQVHKKVFTKPVSDMLKLEDALLLQIELCIKKERNIE